MTTKNTVIYLTILLASIFQIQCVSTRNSRSEYKALYIDQFKLTYLRKVLIKSHNNSNAIQEIINSDHSGFTEPILTDGDYRFIDSLATAENDIMKIDSVEGHRRAEGSEGKRPLKFILEKFNGRTLDKIARERLKLSGVPEWWTY